MTKRVFISFNYDRDEDLKHCLIGQSGNPDSPFSTDWLVREALSGNWKEKGNWKKEVRTRLRNKVDVVAVICGHRTDTATGVNAEVRIAREEGIPYFLLAGRREGPNKKPTAALDTDKIYNWTWDNLKRLIEGKR